MRSDELEAFKSQINLCEYASSCGFILDRKETSRSSAVMRHTEGDKIIVTRKANRHWIYFNVHDDNDQGTIIDFIQLRDRTSLGAVRKILRPWLGRPAEEFRVKSESHIELEPSHHDAGRVLAVWTAAITINRKHDFLYLERERNIPKDVLSDPVFTDRIRTDKRCNALFPHYNSEGLCGIEIKNRQFTGFSPGGVKGLWCSRPRADDRELIICETAIDSLSYAVLFGTHEKRFVSTAGQISPAQAVLLQSAAGKLPEGSSIVLAMDNDEGGRKIVDAITQLLSEANFDQEKIITRLPEREGDDWNDVLKQNQTADSPSVTCDFNEPRQYA